MTYAHAHVLERRRHDQPCPICNNATLPQTALEAIRRYEHMNRIHYDERLDLQPCEVPA